MRIRELMGARELYIADVFELTAPVLQAMLQHVPREALNATRDFREAAMRIILSDSYKCSRCGLQNAPGCTHCATCGLELNTQSAPDPTQQASVPAASSVPAAPHQVPSSTATLTALAPPVQTPYEAMKSVREWLGWKSVDGTVIHVGPSHLMPRRRKWWKFGMWFGIFVLIVYGIMLGIQAATTVLINVAFNSLPLIIVAVLLALGMRKVLRSLGFGQSSGPRGVRGGGFISNVASQFVGFFLTSRLLGQRPTVPVCDYRVRDSNGEEHLVRVEGYVQTGAMNIGDEVLIEGYDRAGTIVFKRGWNKRLRTAVNVKSP